MGSIARMYPKPTLKRSATFVFGPLYPIRTELDKNSREPNEISAIRQARRETSPSRYKSSQPRIHTFILIVFKFCDGSSKSDRETYMDVEDEDENRQLSYYTWVRVPLRPARASFTL